MKYEFDNSRLRGRIVEKFGTCKEFSKHVSQDECKVSRLLTNNAVFTKPIMEEWRIALEIEIEQVGYYFFYSKGLQE